MIKSSVILILKSFSDSEIKIFEEFLNSPFFNKNEKLLDFFSILKKFHPGYDDEKLTKENLYREMFGERKFRESYIRNLFSDLNLLAEKFLQVNQLNKNFTGDKLLIEELNNRNISDLMGKKIKLLEKKVESLRSKDHEYYSGKSFIFEAKSFLMVDKTLTDNFRNDQLKSNLSFFMISVMEIAFYLIIEEQRVKIKHNYEFIDLLLGYLKNHLSDFRESPLLLIYFYLLLSFFEKSNDEEHFNHAAGLFKKHFSSFSKVDKKNIYSMLQTFCINKIESGFYSYNKVLLKILLEMLRFGILSHKEKDYINLNLFRNILILCFTLKEINLLRKFIGEYISKVNPESHESISAYSYAHLYFMQNDFEKSLEQSNKINYGKLLLKTNENLYFKNDIKKLILMCLYELQSFETSFSFIDAHRHFLNSSKLIKDDTKKKYLNFLSAVDKLIKMKIKFDDFKYKKFKERIINDKELMSKNWIIEKLEEFV